MKLETRRLHILPLSLRELLFYLDGDGNLEKELGLAVTERSVPLELLAALRELIIPAVADENNDYLFHTLWTMIDKDSRQIVGDLCFKGEPNEQGEVEIGYGTYESFQRQGYMSEAVEAMTRWAFERPGVHAVIAETDIVNLASHRVLKKNGFHKYKILDTVMAWWRLDKER